MEELRIFLETNLTKNRKLYLILGISQILISAGFWLWFATSESVSIAVPRIVALVFTLGFILGPLFILRYFVSRDPKKSKVYQLLLNNSKEIEHMKISRYMNKYTFLFTKFKSNFPVYITLPKEQADIFYKLIQKNMPNVELRK